MSGVLGGGQLPLAFLPPPYQEAKMSLLTPYQEGKMADNKLFYYKSRDMVTKIHMQWVHYEHSIMGALCHVL